MLTGIDAIHAYAGRCALDVRTLFEARGLDLSRLDNLKMLKKSVAAPWEDPVTHAVNAARPIVAALSDAERESIETLIVSTESGLDFGKSLSTYVHSYLGLSRHCRCFEVKQACYGATAALQMAAHMVAASAPRTPRALVISTDVAADIHGHILINDQEASGNYAEPSLGTGAVAMLVSANPRVMALDPGASGLYSFEVMDTCRPLPGREAGDPDASLLTYMDCLGRCVEHYLARVEGADLARDFEYFAFHTPFAGLVASAHRRMMRASLGRDAATLQADYERRVQPSVYLPSLAGNLYSACLYLALCSLLSVIERDGPFRVGLFSYGSGCSAEFYSGVVRSGAPARVRALGMIEAFERRLMLGMDEYERMSALGLANGLGVRDATVDVGAARHVYDKAFAGQGLLVLDRIASFHREYRWS